MKVIDLLNKRANGEEIPKKIRISGWSYKFEWEEHLTNYYDNEMDIDLMSALSMDKEELNREIEIIEEDKPIEEINNIKQILDVAFSNLEDALDKINRLENKLKKEGK